MNVDWAKLRRELRRRCTDEDAVQEALVRVLTRAEMPANPLGYALRVAWLEAKGSKRTRYVTRYMLVDDRQHEGRTALGSIPAEQEKRAMARQQVERLHKMGVRNLDSYELEG